MNKKGKSETTKRKIVETFIDSDVDELGDYICGYCRVQNISYFYFIMCY